MMRTVIAALTLLAATARAQAPIPAEQWTPAAHLLLARAQVAEASWNQRDHDAIAWVLARRWSMRRDGVTFAEVVRQYSAPMRGRPRSFRVAWVHGLTMDGARPAMWPRSARWSRYAPRWRSVLERAAEWAKGAVADPSKGRAIHWGGTTDAPLRGHSVLSLGTENTFYGRRKSAGR